MISVIFHANKPPNRLLSFKIKYNNCLCSYYTVEKKVCKYSGRTLEDKTGKKREKVV